MHRGKSSKQKQTVLKNCGANFRFIGIEVSIAGLEMARKLEKPEAGVLPRSLFPNVNRRRF